eukprot:5005543-Amphidinium_carterae.1
MERLSIFLDWTSDEPILVWKDGNATWELLKGTISNRLPVIQEMHFQAVLRAFPPALSRTNIRDTVTPR